MSLNEIEVINKIRESKNPELALQIATEIVIAYLMQKESSLSQLGALLPESGAAT